MRMQGGISILGIGLAALAMSGGALASGGSSGGSSGGGWPTTGAPHAAPKPPEYEQALTLIKANKCDEAVPLLQKAADKAPKDADVYNELGFCLRTLGKYPDSFENYRKALTLDPNHRGAREYVGELFLLLNKLDDAQHQLDQLKQLCGECQEKKTLEAAIADYKSKHPDAAVTPPKN